MTFNNLSLKVISMIHFF